MNDSITRDFEFLARLIGVFSVSCIEGNLKYGAVPARISDTPIFMSVSSIPNVFVSIIMRERPVLVSDYTIALGLQVVSVRSPDWHPE